MIKLGLAIFCLICAGLFKAKLDRIAEVGKKDQEWKNKYDLSGKLKNHWWYFGYYKLPYPEKFPFSTTALVFLTDSWHRCQFFMLRFFYLAIALGFSQALWQVLILSFIIFPIVLGVPFEIYYSKLKNEK